MTKPDRRIVRVLVALVIAAYALAASQGVLARLGARALPHHAAGTATDQLATLTVAAETGTGTYQRERFGDGWDSGPDGCDTRTQVLVDESLDPATVDGCTVRAGRWTSLYDGATVTDPAALDIDHLVPLAEAWSSGASDWTDTERQAFANDVERSRPDALIAVTATTNRAKGDSDPTEWLPADPAVRCRYVAAWIAQKATWNLTVDPAEHHTLTDALHGCRTDGAPHG